ncbi:MAG: cupin domain-containing protein [Parafilimonas sp.]|nr:cupin domain-containing protein [Parafilimonas sp.]
MSDLQQYIESGILEAHVLGIASPEEQKEVEAMAAQYAEVREAINAFEYDLEKFATANAVTPDVTIKPILFATIDYTERLKNGEPLSYPKTLNENSHIEDYAEWLNRPDMQLPGDFRDLHATIISRTPQALTLIVWLKDGAPWELHHDEYEKFLIAEGSCDIIIEDTTHHLKAGDYLSIPLHKKHMVKVTSAVPCKVILQRIAA